MILALPAENSAICGKFRTQCGKICKNICLSAEFIVFIGNNDGVTPADIIGATGIKKTAVYSHLQKMSHAKMIVKNEGGKWIIHP